LRSKFPVRRLTHWPLALALLPLSGCSEKPADDLAKPEAPAARVTTEKVEWNLGGVIGAKTEKTTSEPVYRPEVVTERADAAPSPPPVQSGQVTAGDIDDLLNPATYAAYSSRFLQGAGKELPFVDARRRVVIRVVDSAGKPVPFAAIQVDGAQAALHLVAAADGTASIFPGFDATAQQAKVTVASPAGSGVYAGPLRSSAPITVAVNGRAVRPSAMDLALVVDTTGSMGDEMAYLLAELDSIVARLKRNAGEMDLRVSLVVYRDHGDDYLVQTTPLTHDVAAVRAALAAQHADGGGDMPEAMDEALAAAAKLDWRPSAAKALVLLTDAPPHDGDVAPAFEATARLRSAGVQIVPVAASGVDDTAQYVLRAFAAVTQGRYIFLTDDSGIGESHAEPDAACYLVTRLDGLMARVLSGIATGQRVEPRDDAIIRRVGYYDKGQCLRVQQATAQATKHTQS